MVNYKFIFMFLISVCKFEGGSKEEGEVKKDGEGGEKKHKINEKRKKAMLDFKIYL